MTANQNVYMANVENKRHNLATEYETGRHNLAGEVETNRHNVVGEVETNRHNVTTENETARHNVTTENETHRSNVANESLKQESNEITRTHYNVSDATARADQQVRALASTYTNAYNAAQTEYISGAKTDADLAKAEKYYSEARKNEASYDPNFYQFMRNAVSDRNDTVNANANQLRALSSFLPTGK